MGKFLPHTAGSTVSSVMSTTRTVGVFASCLRSATLTRSAAASAATTPAPTMATASVARRGGFREGSVMVDAPCVGSGSPQVAHGVVAADAGDLGVVRGRHEVGVAVAALALDHLAARVPQADDVRIRSRGEGLGVVPAVQRLQRVLRGGLRG